MEQLCDYLLADLDKDTVNFVPNYDNKEKEPTVLPAQFPQLLVNGASGIAGEWPPTSLLTTLRRFLMEFWRLLKTLTALFLTLCSISKVLIFQQAVRFAEQKGLLTLILRVEALY